MKNSRYDINESEFKILNTVFDMNCDEKYQKERRKNKEKFLYKVLSLNKKFKLSHENLSENIDAFVVASVINMRTLPQYRKYESMVGHKLRGFPVSFESFAKYLAETSIEIHRSITLEELTMLLTEMVVDKQIPIFKDHGSDFSFHMMHTYLLAIKDFKMDELAPFLSMFSMHFDRDVESIDAAISVVAPYITFSETIGNICDIIAVYFFDKYYDVFKSIGI